MNGLVNLVKTLGGGLAALSPGCRQAARLQSEALDRRLPLRQRLGLRVHLLLCQWCRRYGRQLAFLRDAARAHPAETRRRSGINRLEGADAARDQPGSYDCPLIQLAAEPVKIPKLLRAYLALGAGICGPPALDREFNANSEVGRPRRRSAGFQPAVSPTSSRRGVHLGVRVIKFPASQVGNPRYSRLEACAT